jgi:transcriptional regulator with XRE-family HTH domain
LSASDGHGEQSQGGPGQRRQGGALGPLDPPTGQTAEPGEDPIVAQRRIRTYLRSLRLRSPEHKTQRQVAAALDWSPVKLLRLEAGHVPIATSDLIALLTQYGITDEKEVSYWVDLARVSRRPTIRDAYRDIFSKPFSEFVQHEAYASAKREYATKLIPGVLQTEEYTEVVLRAYLGDTASQEEIDRRIQARAARSEQLFSTSKARPDIVFIIDEATVRRQVGKESGNPELMVRQLEQLKRVHALTGVTILIVPFDFGMYSALRGPFELLEFPDPADLPILYIENLQGDELFKEDSDEIARYLETFTELEDALRKKVKIDFDEQIDMIIRDMKRPKTARR